MGKRVWAIIGAGHGGQTFAGHMALLGERVRLYCRSREKASIIARDRCIRLNGAVDGVGKLELVSDDLSQVVAGAANIVVVLPSNYHAGLTRKIAPLLQDGQVILLLPEASCGAIEFRKVLQETQCSASVIVGAGCSLPYATRSISPGVCHVSGLKKEVKVAALPATDNARLLEAVSAFPYFVPAVNVIETSIDNINAMMHPAPVLLNISRIEKEPEEEFEWYTEGMTPSVGAILEKIDAERIAVAAALGVEQRTLKRNYIEMYDCGTDDMPLYQVIQQNKGYAGIKNVKSIRSRYVLEDVPYSLVAISSLGKIAGVTTPCIDAICLIYKAILGDQLDTGRDIPCLGLENLSRMEFLHYING